MQNRSRAMSLGAQQPATCPGRPDASRVAKIRSPRRMAHTALTGDENTNALEIICEVLISQNIKRHKNHKMLGAMDVVRPSANTKLIKRSNQPHRNVLFPDTAKGSIIYNKFRSLNCRINKMPSSLKNSRDVGRTRQRQRRCRRH